MAQFGLNGDPNSQAAWQRASLRDEPPMKSNTAADPARGKRLPAEGVSAARLRQEGVDRPVSKVGVHDVRNYQRSALDTLSQFVDKIAAL
jgi:hypothetical protein